MVYVLPLKALNGVVAHLDKVHEGLHHEAKEIETRAKANLAAVRGSTRWTKIHPESSPPHMTSVGVAEAEGKYGSIDYSVYLEALDPMAEEFGHAPSGVFGPGGELSHIQTRAPSGTYILTGAAGFERLQHASSGMKRGKR